MNSNSIHPDFINEAMNCSSNVLEPKPGMLGTLFVGSDRYPIVVLEVLSPKTIRIAEQLSIDGINSIKFTENDVEYVPDDYIEAIKIARTPNKQFLAERYKEYFKNEKDLEEEYSRCCKQYDGMTIFTLRKNGRWVRKSEKLNAPVGVHLGAADYYLDPTF